MRVSDEEPKVPSEGNSLPSLVKMVTYQVFDNGNFKMALDQPLPVGTVSTDGKYMVIEAGIPDQQFYIHYLRFLDMTMPLPPDGYIFIGEQQKLQLNEEDMDNMIDNYKLNYDKN